MSPVRTSLRLLLVLGLIVSTQGLLLVQGAYVLRQDFVVEHLCVNLDRPEVHCNGKCHLRKQLDEQQERDGQRAGLELLLSGGWLAAPVAEAPPPARTALEFASLPAWRPFSPLPPGVFRPPQAF